MEEPKNTIDSAENDENNNMGEEKKNPIIKYGGIIFLIAIILIFVILAVLKINFGRWLADTAFYFYDKGGYIGIYVGVFVISIFGNFTVIFPVPYTIALVVLSAVVPGVNPFLMGFSGGLGAGIGEVSAWLIGRGTQETIGDHSENMQRMKKLVDKGWAPALIFLFAATPLPDDAFLIVLGYASYSIVKTLVYCFLGKFVLCFFSSAIPIWLKGTSIGDFMLNLYGIDVNTIGVDVIPESTPQQIIVSTITWIVSIAVIFLLIYVDWEKLLSRKKKD